MKAKISKEDQLVEDIILSNEFLNHAKTEYNEDNVLYYTKAIALKSLEGDNKAYREKLKEFFDTFVPVGSKLEINLKNNKLRTDLKAALLHAEKLEKWIGNGLRVVDIYREKLFQQMVDGSFKSFKKTKTYKRFKKEKDEWFLLASQPGYEEFEKYDKKWDNGKKLFQLLNEMEKTSGDYNAFMTAYKTVANDFFGPTPKFPTHVVVPTNDESIDESIDISKKQRQYFKKSSQYVRNNNVEV